MRVKRGGNAAAVVAVVIALSEGCWVPDGDDGPEGWRGRGRHLVAGGRVGEQAVRIEFGEEAGEASRVVWCERTYLVPTDDRGMPDYAKGVLSELRVHARLGGASGPSGFVMRLSRHDFQSDAVPREVTVVPRDDFASPGKNATWLEWEWRDRDDAVTYSGAAQEGIFVLELWEGVPAMENGLVIDSGTGAVGGYLRGRWKLGEEVRVSFTVACGDSDVVQQT